MISRICCKKLIRILSQLEVYDLVRVLNFTLNFFVYSLAYSKIVSFLFVSSVFFNVQPIPLNYIISILCDYFTLNSCVIDT